MEAEKITVGQINSNHLYKSITVHGKIIAIGSIRPKLIKGTFKCKYCEEITILPQENSDKLIEPDQCAQCERKARFKLVHDESEWMDERQFILQDIEFSDREITVIVRGLDLINKIGEVSAHSDVTGTIHIIEEKKGFDRILLATNIENKPFEMIEKSSNPDRKKAKIIHGIIKELQQPKHGERLGSASINEIIDRAEEAGIGKEKTKDLIQKLKSAGEVIESSNERFRIV